MNETIENEQVRRGPGRPRKEQAREPSRNGVRVDAHTGRVAVEGHNGEVLSRKQTSIGDPFYIPPEIIPKGWDYQWNTFTVAGEEQREAQINMYQNGWRPVPAERHPGIFMPDGHKGAVLRGGQRLEERPLALSMEARREEEQKAAAQMHDQSAQFGLSGKLGKGFDQRGYLPGGRTLRTNVEHPTDIPRPQLQIDADS